MDRVWKILMGVVVVLLLLIAAYSMEIAGLLKSGHLGKVDVSPRFQIVNGTPELSRNIMLLDTKTGDSWLICSGSDGVTGWCEMSKSFQQAAAKATKPPAPSVDPKKQNVFDQFDGDGKTKGPWEQYKEPTQRDGK